MKSNLEEKYRKLSDIDHCLQRPGMWIGSTKHRDDDVWIFFEGQFEKKRISYNPAFLKIFDEIISNSVDEHRRNPKLNEIHIDINVINGSISVRDNGGIPVLKHAEYDEWIPEMIFSNLKAGSNFNDDEERLVAGTNGVGSTLTNIFSKRFIVETCDGKNVFNQEFSNNMRDRSEPSIKKSKQKGFTNIIYFPDLSQFEMKTIDDFHLLMMKKRAIDLAACNPNLKISFNNEIFEFPSFEKYCSLYSENYTYDECDRWRVAFAPSDGAFSQISFVNSVETRDGGSHVDHVISQVIDWLREKVKKKHKIDLRPSELKNHFFVMVQSDIVNPAFSSQTKEKLITDQKDFGSKFSIKEKSLKSIFESEIVQRVLDWAQQKALADERKQLRELNKDISKGKVLKLIDAKARVDRESCTLSLFEGDSASSSFRKYRNPMTQGAFPLRGKFINVAELPNTKVIKNQEVKDLLTAIGLKIGEEPKGLRYGKILIYSDADPDGDSIAGLLMNFFGRYWPELFDQHRICRVMTPLVVAKKGNETLSFYTSHDFEDWLSKIKDSKKWDIAYKKGLAALEDEEYKEIIQNPKLFSIAGGKDLKPTLEAWFSGDSSIRKQKILGIEENDDTTGTTDEIL